MDNKINCLCTKTPEEQYDFMNWLLNDYGKQFTDTRQAVIDWLNKAMDLQRIEEGGEE